MKQAFLVLAMAGFFASCDNAANTADRTKDSLDSIAKIQKESINEAGSEAKENIDSTTQALKDSVEKTHDHSDSANHSN